MREPLHTETTRLRIPSGLLSDARKQARSEGRTLSEFIRQSIRAQVMKGAGYDAIEVD